VRPEHVRPKGIAAEPNESCLEKICLPWIEDPDEQFRVRLAQHFEAEHLPGAI